TRATRRPSAIGSPPSPSTTSAPPQPAGSRRRTSASRWSPPKPTSPPTSRATSWPPPRSSRGTRTEDLRAGGSRHRQRATDGGRIVGDDGVDSKPSESADLVGIVDRPHVDPKPSPPPHRQHVGV